MIGAGQETSFAKESAREYTGLAATAFTFNLFALVGVLQSSMRQMAIPNCLPGFEDQEEGLTFTVLTWQVSKTRGSRAC